MTNWKFIFMAVLAMALMLPLTAICQPNISGPLSGTLGPGTYNVVGNCQVQTGQSLTIAPGTTLQFTGNYNISIYGGFQAIGTQAAPIRFTTSTPYGIWGGLRFYTGCPTSSRMEWCEVEKCNTAGNGGGIYVGNGGITIINTSVTNCTAGSGGGIFVDYSPNTIIESSYIAYCTAGNGGGIFFNSSNGPILRYSEVAYNVSTNT